MRRASEQLNQQSAKGATAKDFSFLTEVSPIYVTSLTGNHVSGTTTLTTSNLSSSNFNHSQSATASTANNSSGSQSNPNRIQSIVHVHQPPAIHHINKIPAPLAGGWLIGESAQGHLITTNEQQVFQNILNNNNNNQTNSNNLKSLNSGKCAGGTVLYSGNCISSTSESNITSFSGNNSNLVTALTTPTTSTTGSNTCELLANGHGPKKEVRHLHRSENAFSFFFFRSFFFHFQIIHHHICVCFNRFDSANGILKWFVCSSQR